MRSILIALAIVSVSCATRASHLGYVDLLKPPAEMSSKAKGQWTAPSYVDQARAAFPEAKRRFLEGLLEGCELRVQPEVKDSAGHVSTVIVVVDKIENGWVTGHWWEGMARAVYDTQDIYTFSEKDVLDWVIVRPNGVTEGNWGPRALGTEFAVAQWYTGPTCDQAKDKASSAIWSEAKTKCGALGARACRVVDQAWFLGTCEWDETSKLYRIQGVSSYGCCV